MGTVWLMGGVVAPRLVFVHGIGGPRRVDADRGHWISALVRGARQAGHSKAAQSLADGSLAEVVFAYYGDLFQRAQAQGAGSADLDEDEAVLLTELLGEVVDTHLDAHDGRDDESLARALAQLRPSGEAEGTGDLIRRATNAATTLLGARPWGRAGQWVSGQLLVRDLAQVARYLARGEPDENERTLDMRIRDVVAGALGPDPAVVIAHSLGSIVSFEMLHDYSHAVPLWVTLGSPLAMRAVVWPKVWPRPPATPDTVMCWLNFWDRDDIIVTRPILESDIAANTSGVVPKSTRVDSDGVWVHAATKYLAKADVAGPVIEAIQVLKSGT
jgi:pimeloyl-ACP methyl ester carboxylesterase